MANFILRLLKRKVADKTKRQRLPSHKADDSSDAEDDDDDEGVVESKFDYDEGVMTSAESIRRTSLDDLEVCKASYHRHRTDKNYRVGQKSKPQAVCVYDVNNTSYIGLVVVNLFCTQI